MRITEPYNGTIVADNYIKDYVYITLKHNKEVSNILENIYSKNTNYLKADIDIVFDKYGKEYKELMLDVSKLDIISDIKDRVLQKYMILYYEKLKVDLNRTIIA